jgi:hypothetical protein
MRTRRNRSFRPEISGLEGRELLSTVGAPKAIVGAPKAIVAAPNATVAAPPVTTFSDTSNAAPALVEFGGKTLLVWRGSANGALNVATVATKGPSGYQLESAVSLQVASNPNLTPAATVFDSRLYLAWTDTNGHLNVISSADGVHFTSKVTLADTSNTGPTLAAFDGRLYLGWTGTNGHLNVESSANGTTFSNKVILSDTSDLSPALATFDGRLYLAWTGTNSQLNVESSANGTTFSNKVSLEDSSVAAPALTVEQPAVKGEPTRLILGWTSTLSQNPQINFMASTNGETFADKVTFNTNAFGGLALVSPSAGTLDIAWDGFQPPPRHLNLMQV